jgi:hypothetical protein
MVRAEQRRAAYPGGIQRQQGMAAHRRYRMPAAGGIAGNQALPAAHIATASRARCQVGRAGIMPIRHRRLPTLQDCAPPRAGLFC